MQRGPWHEVVLSVPILIFPVFFLGLPLRAQETLQQSPSAQKQALEKTTMDQIAKDLAEVNAELLKASQPEPESSGYRRSASTESTSARWFFLDRYIGRDKPSAGATETTPFSNGESARILDRKGDWDLVENSQDQVGWVPASHLSMMISDQAFENAIAAALKMLSKMKEKYENGPVVIKGFSVDVMPPGVSVEFEFKESRP
jgi:hypothetical protein